MVAANATITAIPDADVERARSVAAAVPDPEIPVLTLEDLGVLRRVYRTAAGIVVEVTPTYTGCPATAAIMLSVEAALADVGVRNASVRSVLSPAWSTDDITEAGRTKLKAYGIAPPGKGSPAMLFADEQVACPKCGSQHTTRVSEFGSTPCKAHWRCDDCREPFDYFKCHR
jgi:ring-1,2-phenylacetyl-CoA epoxidase subunit PaaD